MEKICVKTIEEQYKDKLNEMGLSVQITSYIGLWLLDNPNQKTFYRLYDDKELTIKSCMGSAYNSYGFIIDREQEETRKYVYVSDTAIYNKDELKEDIKVFHINNLPNNCVVSQYMVNGHLSYSENKKFTEVFNEAYPEAVSELIADGLLQISEDTYDLIKKNFKVYNLVSYNDSLIQTAILGAFKNELVKYKNPINNSVFDTSINKFVPRDIINLKIDKIIEALAESKQGGIDNNYYQYLFNYIQALFKIKNICTKTVNERILQVGHSRVKVVLYATNLLNKVNMDLYTSLIAACKYLFDIDGVVISNNIDLYKRHLSDMNFSSEHITLQDKILYLAHFPTYNIRTGFYSSAYHKTLSVEGNAVGYYVPLKNLENNEYVAPKVFEMSLETMMRYLGDFFEMFKIQGNALEALNAHFKKNQNTSMNKEKLLEEHKRLKNIFNNLAQFRRKQLSMEVDIKDSKDLYPSLMNTIILKIDGEDMVVCVNDFKYSIQTYRVSSEAIHRDINNLLNREPGGYDVKKLSPIDKYKMQHFDTYEFTQDNLSRSGLIPIDFLFDRDIVKYALDYKFSNIDKRLRYVRPYKGRFISKRVDVVTPFFLTEYATMSYVRQINLIYPEFFVSCSLFNRQCVDYNILIKDSVNKIIPNCIKFENMSVFNRWCPAIYDDRSNRSYSTSLETVRIVKPVNVNKRLKEGNLDNV